MNSSGESEYGEKRPGSRNIQDADSSDTWGLGKTKEDIFLATEQVDADTVEARSPKGKASLIYAKHKFSFGCSEFKEPKKVRWLALELRGEKKTRKCQTGKSPFWSL